MNLDLPNTFKKIDTGGVMDSILLLADQVEQAWKEVNSQDVPQNCSTAKNVVICGMGGSALGGRIVDSLKDHTSRTPIEIFNSYKIPSYAGQDTLVILSSYSGNTEETISCAHEALSKKTQIFIISTGGELSKIAKENSLPSYIFTPQNNPANQPRLALGYSVSSILAVLSKCNFISLEESEIKDSISTIRNLTKEFGPHSPENSNLAKSIARNLKNKIPILIASEHLVGSAHAFKNQLNEGAKTFSDLFELPELNHHLMEGLKNPILSHEFLKFLLIESDLYFDRIQTRYEITKDVLEKNKIAFVSYKATSQTKLEQAFEVLTLGSFTHYYLAMLYEIDPTPIPWVDYFKSRLSKQN